MQTTPLDKVLALRPTNAVMRFGQESRLPVLNPRDLLAAVDAAGSALACIPIYSHAAIGGVLRASRDEDAVIGLSCPFPLAERESPVRFVDTVREIAEEVRHRKPFFLQAGPVRLTSTDDRERERLASAIYKFVEAGFTLISVDASTLAPEDAVTAYQALTAAAAERELSVEIAAPVDVEGRLVLEALQATLEELARAQVAVNFVRVPGRAYSLEATPREPWQLDLSNLKGASDLAESFGAVISIEDDGLSPDQLASSWLDAKVRKAEPAEAAARIVLGQLSAERVQQLTDAASSSGVSRRDLLASMSMDPGPDANARLRIEALHWSMVTDLLPNLRARGTASEAIAFLAQAERY